MSNSEQNNTFTPQEQAPPGLTGQMDPQRDVDPVNSPYPRNDLREERDGDQWEHGKSSDPRVSGGGTAEALASTAKEAGHHGGRVTDRDREDAARQRGHQSGD